MLSAEQVLTWRCESNGVSRLILQEIYRYLSNSGHLLHLGSHSNG